MRAQSEKKMPERMPLYEQVREELVSRMISGAWPHGMLLPSEFQLADELQVSQGTVRKALDRLTRENLLVRRQGRGTFVALPGDRDILFRFYRLTPDTSTERESLRFPDSRVLGIASRPADDRERAALELPGGAEVWRIDRIRLLEDTPVLCERLTLPVSRFPDLDRHAPLPNNVYELYGQKFGITVARVVEKLKAVVCDGKTAGLLNVGQGTPLLQIDRRAIALDGQVVEWRVSLCLTQDMHYLSEL